MHITYCLVNNIEKYDIYLPITAQRQIKGIMYWAKKITADGSYNYSNISFVI